MLRRTEISCGYELSMETLTRLKFTSYSDTVSDSAVGADEDTGGTAELVSGCIAMPNTKFAALRRLI